MTWQTHLRHEFVDRIPRDLEPGCLYVSMKYSTAAHRCACGCSEEVMTPLSPTDWRLIFDGETVSLLPSIGNWQLPCRSHYFIEKGEVVRAEAWSEQRIRNEQRRDRQAKTDFYGAANKPSEEPTESSDGLGRVADARPKRGLMAWLFRR